MAFTKAEWVFLVFNIVYIIGFGFYYIRNINYEFIAYVVLIIGVVVLIYGTLHITKFPIYIIGGLSIWGLLHMMGGSVMTEDGVLYAWKIVHLFDGGGEFYVLKFDQLVHAGLYAIVALMFLHLLRNYFLIGHSQVLVAFVAAMAALGVSSLNEIIEFTAVVLIPETSVGGYYNTLLDIVFNFIGAVAAVAGYYVFKRIE